MVIRDHHCREGREPPVQKSRRMIGNLDSRLIPSIAPYDVCVETVPRNMSGAGET